MIFKSMEEYREYWYEFIMSAISWWLSEATLRYSDLMHFIRYGPHYESASLKKIFDACAPLGLDDDDIVIRDALGGRWLISPAHAQARESFSRRAAIYMKLFKQACLIAI